MKTLNEVIKALEWCIDDSHDDCDGCPYETGEVTDCHEKNVDALHYLQTYRADKLEWEQTRQANEERYQEAVRNCERAENKFIARLKELNIGTLNDPLTWSELKTMEGKPVWVEGEHGCIWGQKAWSLIRLDPENDDIVICISTDGGVHYEFAIGQEDYGTDWQAYRKERE